MKNNSKRTSSQLLSPEAAELLKLLHDKNKENKGWFVPKTLEQIEAYSELEKLELVKTIHSDFRVSNDGRVKDGFIECVLSNKAESLIPS
jgi:hypothetical protein